MSIDDKIDEILSRGKHFDEGKQSLPSSNASVNINVQTQNVSSLYIILFLVAIILILLVFF